MGGTRRRRGRSDLIFKQPTPPLRAQRSNPSRNERKVDCFAALAMTCRYDFAISPHVLREVLSVRSALPKEGAGNAGRPMRPQPGRAEKQAMPVVTVTTVTPEITRHSPRNGFTVSFALAPETGFLVSVGDNAHALHRISASGYQADTASPSASSALVSHAKASIASRPAAVTIACRPSVGRDGAGHRSDLGPAASEKF